MSWRLTRFVAVLGLGILAHASSALAWDSADCRAKCRATATLPNGYDICVAKWHCDVQFKGGAHEFYASTKAGKVKGKRQ